jgi:hypothetical protein
MPEKSETSVSIPTDKGGIVQPKNINDPVRVLFCPTKTSNKTSSKSIVIKKKLNLFILPSLILIL